MKCSQTMWLASLVLSASLITRAQNTDTQSPQPTDTQSQQQTGTQPQQSQEGTAPAPAFGQTAPILSPENPPISGIDEPRLDLRRALRSFVSVGLVADESADSNPANQLGNNATVRSVTHLLGAFDLQRFWPKSDLIAEYLGGGAFYTSGVDEVRQLQDVGLVGVTRWRTGQLSVHDSFNYLPEGSFGAGRVPGLNVAEAAGGYGLIGGNIPGIHTAVQWGSVGLIPRISNITIGSVVQSLSPRSAVTLVGSYGFSHFLEEQSTLFNSQQLTTEAGYSYMINRRDQVAAVYAFQEFHFPQSATGKIDAHVLYLRWGRTLSGRMSLVIGAGPQYVMTYQPGILNVTPAFENTHWTVAGRATLRYKFQRSSISASYEKFTSAGSGIFAGADTQVARFTMSRPFSRTWEFIGELGYSHNKRLQLSFLTPSGFAGNYFDSGFAGAIVRKQISRSFGAFAMYRFNELSLQVPSCIDNFGCGRISQRHAATIGVDWHPRPVRIE